MTPGLARELRAAGFPDIQDIQHRQGRQFLTRGGDVAIYSVGDPAPEESWFVPTLEELIEAIPAFARLSRSSGRWSAESSGADAADDSCETPTEAVARLWIALEHKRHGLPDAPG